MRLLIDMNLSPSWADVLADAGIEAVHWSRLGPATASDSAIMAYAAENAYVVMTHDLDFGAILAVTHGRKPSAAQIRSADISPKGIGQQVITALRQMADKLETGALLTIDPERTRLRLPPLPPGGP